jgi:hypothetical protein
MIISWFAVTGFNYLSQNAGFIDADKAYNRIWIYDYIDQKTNKPAQIIFV